MTGMHISWVILRIASLLLGCWGLSSFVLPCTARAATPQLSINLHNDSVSSIFGSNLILQVTGMFKFFTRVVRMFWILSGWVSNAEPMPPLMENSFGQPILTSKAATSFCLHENKVLYLKWIHHMKKLHLHKFSYFKSQLCITCPNLKYNLLFLLITCSKDDTSIQFINKVNSSENFWKALSAQMYTKLKLRNNTINYSSGPQHLLINNFFWIYDIGSIFERQQAQWKSAHSNHWSQN